MADVLDGIGLWGAVPPVATVTVGADGVSELLSQIVMTATETLEDLRLNESVWGDGARAAREHAEHTLEVCALLRERIEEQGGGER